MRQAAREHPIRVLHTPSLVGGHPTGLAAAERALGLESRVVAIDESEFGYEADETLSGSGGSRLSREGHRWKLLARALATFDVVHFNFGSSIMPRWYPADLRGVGGAAGAAYGVYSRAFELRDLPLLRLARKGIFVTYQGDDARQADALRRYAVSPVDEAGYDARLDARKRTAIAAFDRYADRIYALNPDLLHVLPARAQFLPYASVDVERWQPVVADRPGPPVALHAPSHRGAKGTRFVLDAVERLRTSGVELELLLVEGMTREQARTEYERADLLVDQVLAGWYGGLAVELMALGKPVVAYIRDEDLDVLPEGMRSELPVISATPATLEDTLRDWLTTRRGALADLGRRSRAYVERWHDPHTIAARVVKDYEDVVRERRG